MSEQIPAPADRSRSRESMFLLAIAVLVLAAGALSFLYIQNAEQTTPVITADEPRSVPLPAGPRKYQ